MDGTSRIHRNPQPAQILSAIAALPARSLVATDADNTVWAGDVGDEVVRLATTPPHAPWQPGQADFAGYMVEMERDYPQGCRFAAELLRRVDPATARGPLESALRRQVQPRRWLIEALQAAMERGVQVWLVSASPRLAVEIGADLFGLGQCRVIAVDCLSVDPSRFLDPVPIGMGKVEAWRSQGLPAPDLALGDSTWDLPLLESARQGLLVQRACDDPRCHAKLADLE